ncbi:MAG: tyrosine-protein kinase family protein [Plesiomonas sp.]|uniref:tyrosine-protein kinase family protein n=1 Tax=Plesiomonas sp. TaxID=2486279 RepID=UPI003F30FCA8
MNKEKEPEYHKEIDILFDRALSKGIRTLAITSAVHQEGVSSSALAFAKRCVQANMRTLLIELSITAPILPTLYPNVGNVLVSSVPNTSSVNFPAIHQVSSLFSLATTLTRVEPSDRWYRKNFTQLLSDFTENYDIVIFDIPPITLEEPKYLPSEIACACCDATVLSILFSRTQESEIKDALKKLKQTECNIIGFIANDRFNPTLASDLTRETYRLENRFPRLMEKLRARIKKSAILSFKL